MSLTSHKIPFSCFALLLLFFAFSLSQFTGFISPLHFYVGLTTILWQKTLLNIPAVPDQISKMCSCSYIACNYIVLCMLVWLVIVGCGLNLRERRDSIIAECRRNGSTSCPRKCSIHTMACSSIRPCKSVPNYYSFCLIIIHQGKLLFIMPNYYSLYLLSIHCCYW